MNDILLQDFDLKIVNGDFVIGESTQQHQELLLLCNKGSFKANPAVCVGLEMYLEGEDPVNLIAEIKSQFTGDGMDVKDVKIVNGKLLIDASYRTV